MKKTIKAKYVLFAIAFLFISIFILNINKNVSDKPEDPEISRTDNDIHFDNQQSVIDKDQKKNNYSEINAFKIGLSELKKNNSEEKDINKSYINNPRNLKLKSLIGKIVSEVPDLPQSVWEPSRFTEKDIDEHIANLEKIILYSDKVKMNNSSTEDRIILSNLISNEIKDKIEYFKTSCAKIMQMSVARNDEDQEVIDNDFKDCNEVVKELENKLNYYETRY